MSIRKALGAVKDQTSISIAKVTGGGAVSPDLDVAVVRATSHDAAPADARHAAQILRLISSSPNSHVVSACVASVARRLSRTRDYVVAAKCLALLHRLLNDAADPRSFLHELLRPAAAGRRAGEPLLALLVDFRDEAHPASWDHSAFVRAYAAYLDARARFLLPPPPRAVHFADDPVIPSSATHNSLNNSTSKVREMDPEALLTRSRQLRHVLDRALACRPTGGARTSRVVLAALFPVLKDTFQLHADAAVVLAVLLDRFFDMEYQHCVKAFEAYVGAAKQIDELLAFYAWCVDAGVARPADFPAGEVNRIDDGLLETLEQFLRERGRAAHQNDHNQSSSSHKVAPTTHHQLGRLGVQDDHGQSAEAEYFYDDMNRVKALPAPPEPKSSAPTAHKNGDQLVDLREPAATADEQGNKLALALFNAPTNGDWVAFPSDGDDDNDGKVIITSAWQTPAAEPGKGDWELALVETASNLSRQKATLGGGMDTLLLGGMYDHGAVCRHVAAASSGSASSVVSGATTTPVLALPTPDGTVQAVGNADPFAASLAVPPPAYVQMAEMERKQELLLQEQRMWAQYRQGGMQGQIPAGGSVFASNTAVTPMMMPSYGMPAMAYNYNQVGGYY
ncbi:hypothetical protein QOZ80_5AG0407890 [Eleusine coracana subsp. coracana]|nr:hypothetical protein QOZ80_5AG0407890 [Eleusine coracana subsp. coracana]